VVRNLPRAQHLKETARSSFRTFLVDKRRLRTVKARQVYRSLAAALHAALVNESVRCVFWVLEHPPLPEIKCEEIIT